ncbi:MAG TPA: thioesterase family protein, partial [Pseudomonadales bacterium]|nr:thioesterase family protein [Pseudomonadales bacterium]
MSEPNIAQDLIRILDLEQIDVNLFRGEHETVVHSRLFGGQVLAQSLAAADKTVPQDRLCHSLHGYFLRPGRSDIAVVYRVERIRDGQSFTTRRIVAIQNGEAIFSMDASFQMLE